MFLIFLTKSKFTMHETFHARNVIPRKLPLDDQRSSQRGKEKKGKAKMR